jgi:hypothetical protein
MQFEERVSQITKKKLRKNQLSSKTVLKNSLVRSTKTGLAANIPRAVLKHLKATVGDNLYFTISKSGIKVTTAAPKTKAISVKNFISHTKKFI